MHVEDCCLALLDYILPEIDPDQNGYCLDVGVGTFAFYCERTAKLGFPTIAVEPLPVAKLRRLCDRHSIQLIEACLSDHNGTQTFYMGKFARFSNSNFNSLKPNWFGSSSQTKQVKTFDLAELLRITNVEKITCLKLDVEGWEPVAIKQLIDLPPSQLPLLTMFEYGGGGLRHRGNGGWSSQFLDGTLTCLQTLKQCGYGFSVVIDYAHEAEAKFFDLRSHSLDPDEIFLPNAIYGNIISFRDSDYPPATITQISQHYEGGVADWFVKQVINWLVQ
ncbi:MAG: FkbM family methyltransferase [Cyanobacteria bacterium J06592_8]